MATRTTLQSLNNQQNFLRILIFSFVTIMIWIAFSIFRSQQAPQISPELQQMALPLNPTIDLDVITRIEQKKTYTDDELSNFPIFALNRDKTGNQTMVILNNGVATPVTPTPSPTPEPTVLPATLETPPSTSSSAVSP